jgi:hypothetical protein
LVRRGNGRLLPHLSLAKCKSERQAKSLIDKLSSRLLASPVEFPVCELLLLSRKSELGRGMPFHLHSSVLFASSVSLPLFGPSSLEWETTSVVARQVVLIGDASLETEKSGLKVVWLKKRSKPSIGVVTFDDASTARNFVATHKNTFLSNQTMYP